MMLAHMKNQLCERMDHIEKHLAAARAQFLILDSDAPLRDKIKSVLALGTEFEIIKADAERALLDLGDRQANERVLADLKDVIDMTDNLKELSKSIGEQLGAEE